MLSLAASAVLSAVSALAVVSELPPIPADLSTPVQQRLAYHGPTAMAVAWNTYQVTVTPTVHYGLSPNSLNMSASSMSSVTYKTSRTWANTVIIQNLRPVTTYYYKIDSTNSSIDSFVTGRTPGDMTPFTASAVIDMGVFGANGVTVSRRDLIPRIDPSLEHTTIGRLVVMASEYDFVVHPGDLAYADDWLLGQVQGKDPGTIFDGPQIYEGLIEQFFNQLSAVSRMKPYMVSPGNHEADCTEIPLYPCVDGQKNFTGYINRFGSVMPASFSLLANPPFWYSFDYGMVHFVMFDTETDLGKGLISPEEFGGRQLLNNGPFGTENQQINFLNVDLSSVNRKVTPWVVVAGHRPWYTDGAQCTECQKAFEPLFIKYGVDLAVFVCSPLQLAGHVHNMQRIAPISNGVVDPAGLNNPQAPWYIVNGAAGNIEGLSTSSSPPKYVQWTNDDLYGFSKLIFHNKTNLEVH